MPDEIPLSNEARQAGFGLASFVLVMSLIARLIQTNRVSRQGALDIIDHALLGLEMRQGDAPLPQETVVAARQALQTALAALSQKPNRGRRDRPKST
jgi:hypothetical protein